MANQSPAVVMDKYAATISPLLLNRPANHDTAVRVIRNSVSQATIRPHSSFPPPSQREVRLVEAVAQAQDDQLSQTSLLSLRAALVLEVI